MLCWSDAKVLKICVTAKRIVGISPSSSKPQQKRFAVELFCRKLTENHIIE